MSVHNLPKTFKYLYRFNWFCLHGIKVTLSKQKRSVFREHLIEEAEQFLISIARMGKIQLCTVGLLLFCLSVYCNETTDHLKGTSRQFLTPVRWIWFLSWGISFWLSLHFLRLGIGKHDRWSEKINSTNVPAEVENFRWNCNKSHGDERSATG